MLGPHRQGQNSISIEVPLVKLIKHHRANTRQPVGASQHPQIEPLCDEEDACRRTYVPLVAGLIPDQSAHLAAHLLSHTPSQQTRGQAPRLQHHDAPINLVQKYLWNLGRFPGTGWRAEHNPSVGLKGGSEFGS